ncbi:MAG: hypothetical protein GC190_18525 [Alphaproteobacteria bacterium]|nr:hypothetical protein [Alphaproteobacteria bacterium]
MLDRVLAGTGVLASFAASTCCVLPIGVSALGLSTASLSGFMFLAPYRLVFEVVAIFALGVGFWMTYGRGRPSGRVTKVMLWLGTIILALVLTSGLWHGLLA